MSTITKQWLQQKIAEMEATRDDIPFGLGEDGANTLAALRIALASLEAEAVALRDERSGSGGISKKPGFNDLPHGTPLYAAPPAPVALPVQHWEELCRQNPDMSIGDAIIRAAWWNHCAAMLQGAEPVTTANKLPDGYVLVPVEPTAEMLQSGISAHFERSQTQIHDRPAPGPMECAYVAMLAAAPQQEVK